MNDVSLKCCPSCDFIMEEFREHQKIVGEAELDGYWPVIYKDRLINQWVIECLNCGMVVIFGMDKVASITAWNDLPRRELEE